MKRVVTFSFFKGNFFGDGGQKRTKQLEVLISDVFDYNNIYCSYKLNDFRNVPLLSKLLRIYYIPRVLLCLKSNLEFFRVTGLLDEAYRFYRMSNFLKSVESDFILADTVVWECNLPGFFYLPYLLKTRYHKRVIACPHNLESIVPFQKFDWYGQKKISRFVQELETLKLCDKVFTISEEEQWMLTLFDVNVEGLPYFPLGKSHDELLNIREYRMANHSQNFFLIVGSATNPPTREGMRTLLSMIRDFNTEKQSLQYFKVAGFGTEMFREEFNSNEIDILGAVDSAVLNGLMKACKGIVINQGYSTGALTKIPEALVAGIPIVSDAGSARSYRRSPGLYVFNSKSELSELLLNQFGIPPMPDKPTQHFNYFMKDLS